MYLPAGTNTHVQPSDLRRQNTPDVIRVVYHRSVSCIFCGRTPVTKEHVFPQWLNRYLPSGEAQILEQSRYGAGAYDVSRRNIGLDFCVRKVCAQCNNGWMSKLEAESIDLLDPLINDLGLRLISLHDQRRIALWATKTAMVLDNTQSDPVLPQNKLARMRSNRAIPRGARVWLGAFAERQPMVTGLTVRIDTVDIDNSGTPLPTGLYTPIKIGHMCLYVYFPMMDFVIQNRPPYTMALARIWPRRASDLPWPPPAQPANGAAFEEFADGFRRAWRVFTPDHAQRYKIRES